MIAHTDMGCNGLLIFFFFTNITSCSTGRIRFFLRWETNTAWAAFLHAFTTFTTFDHTPFVGLVINAVSRNNSGKDGSNE
ncbi:hypothetical protein V8B55DRAFT_1456728 [Mucor lusitanicus]|uniref:Uncharacterized protein n=1 Tax=Mucor circinelloides f. lusitanicus TaxID=29924 RepID=A0A8H4F4W2_MUCCL|nr:hypothetical protein FB192DRAFT_1350460 [Mucor lusitanicus]